MIRLTGDLNAVIYEPTLTGKMPAVIFLHGIGERGSDLSAVINFIDSPYNNINNAIATVFNGKQFVLIAPQLPTTEGEWQNSYVDRAYNHLLTLPYVDPARISIIGVSLGGGGVWKYISASVTNAKKFNVAIVICGVGGWSNLKNIADAGLPVWAFHATDDNVVGVGNTHSAVDGINSFNPAIKAKKTIYPTGGHYIWARALDPVNPPGINGETIGVWHWSLLNTNLVHVPVPTGIADKPADPLPTTLKAVATVTNLTATTATLDGSKSEGKINWQTWELVSAPAGAKNTWTVFSSGKGNIVTNLQNLSAGDWVFRLTVHGSTGSNSADVKFTVGAVKAPVLKEGAVPPGSTKYILRTDNTIEFT